ncbi:regulatory iron-sulfur-containing complex subunit RicT [uncultured Fluviicola sp.]|uniref:PSP1 domain-containing protein n=1 Tax=uncultured Fluviicola sp. TaxID=463303 RepID=UPI0025E38ECB|nr:regulatory iron-sulfur-containing complex subunit RicT [uncultured Fluviicola sp.]
MGCSSCSSGGGTPRGCKNNGTCSSGGCNKLGVFDWLANMQLPAGQTSYDILEIRFKNSRKTFYRNAKNLSLQVGDVVVVEASPGYDVGVVSVVGELARIQVKKKSPGLKPMETKKILRIANQEDIDKWVQARSLESEVMFQARTLAVNIGLEMKISDVEYQGDLTKATFYYTAEGRVDFRQLIKDMADKFKIRIEMRQIGSRQEAQRLGGIGSCGRELCCSTWLTDFRSVSTSAARYQQLSLNPQKLAGQCGKLKCCLNYELDMYLDAIKSFPSTDVKLQTEKGTAFHIKTDVFKRQLWYMYEGEASIGVGLVALSPERVQDIIKINKSGKKPADLKDFDSHIVTRKEPDYDNVVGQDSLNRFDNTFSKNKKRKKKKSKGNAPQADTAVAAPKPAQKQNKPQGNKPQQDKQQQNRPQQQQNKPQQQNTKPQQQQKPAQNGDRMSPTASATAQENSPQAQANPNKKKNNRRRPPRKNNGGNEGTEK